MILFIKRIIIKSSPKFNNDCYIKDQNLQRIILKKTNVDIIGAYIRTWIDETRNPYKYEFKTQNGSYFYYNPDELIILND